MKLKLKLTKDRKLIGIGTEEFSLTINGKSNTDYKAILAPLGIDLEFEDVDATPTQLKTTAVTAKVDGSQTVS